MTRLALFGAVLWTLVTASVAGAQDVSDGSGGRAPRFWLAQRERYLPLDASRTPGLSRRLVLSLDGATRKTALAEIARQAGIKLVYGDDALGMDRVMHFKAEGITVAAALTEVLFDTGIDVVFSGNRQAALVRRLKGTLTVSSVGTLVGRVTDGKTGDPIVGAEVLLEGTRFRATTGDKGFYRIGDVLVGAYTLTVRRVGYAKRSRPVAIDADQELTADVALDPVATQLNELVTTVTGEQRRLELGHVVGVINADSLVKEAPITTLSQLLTARVPGLVVSQVQGTVGGSVSLQIRGKTSFTLSSEPIVIVDGVRYSSRLTADGADYGAEPASPLNNLNPNDVESVEVVKGPSASTLYGTDAANGVIVITTKRGRVGAPKWNAYVRGMRDKIPSNRISDLYYGWAHDNAGNTFSCTLDAVARGACTQDSVVRVSAPNSSALSVLRPASSGGYGANVSGGQQNLRYFFGADYDDLQGAVGLPDTLVSFIRAQRGVPELPKEFVHPNSQTQLNLRANLTTSVGKRLTLDLNAGFTRANTQRLSGGNGRFFPYTLGSSSTDTTVVTQTILDYFAPQSTDATRRFLLNTTAHAELAPWLSARATIGLDMTTMSQADVLMRDLNRRQDPAGRVYEGNIRQDVLSADVGTTATLRHGPVTFRTSVGGQFTRTTSDALLAWGYDMPPGSTAVQSAAYVSALRSYAEAATLGGYVEETIGLHDRLFFTGAVRIDGASTFGSGYEAAAYPKLSASWLVSQEPFMPRVPGLDELRFRGAWGASGKQPNPRWANPSYERLDVFIPGVPDYVVQLTGLGNPGLRPERTREFEGGVDASFLDRRLRVETTWYRRRTTEQIIQQPLPPGLGYAFTNLGLTSEHGFEVQAAGTVLETRGLSWDITVQHALHGTKLERLGTATPRYSNGGGYVEGYPLGARFIVPIESYADANGDGIIAASEVQLGTSPFYAGENAPRSTQTLVTTLGLFDRQFRLTALFDRQSVTQVNEFFTCGACRGRVDPTTPLDVQAMVAAASKYSQVPSNFFAYVESGTFTRLREISAAVSLPARLARAIGAASVNLTLAARNLALWSDFSGPDPESGQLPNSISRDPSYGIPQSRTWSLRCDLGL